MPRKMISWWLSTSRQRSVFYTFGKVRSFLVVMGVWCLLPGSPGLFKGDAVLLDECQELICSTSMDMVAVLADVIIDLLGTQLPHKLDFSTSFCSDGIGDRCQAAKVRLQYLCNKVLNHNCLSNTLNIDWHVTSIVACSMACCYVRRRAALIFGIRKVEQPICYIHLLQRSIDDMSNSWYGECTVITYHMISTQLSVFCYWGSYIRLCQHNNMQKSFSFERD